MSGFGERFRAAGYTVPKPLIEVEGKPIIEHVIDLFPREADFIFICNRDHLAEPKYKMKDTLSRACPTGKILAIDPHRKGPVHAIMQAERLIDPLRPVLVNYCDFTCFWDWTDFKTFVETAKCSGAIPAYRGFHPHSLGSTLYAYIQHNGDFWATNIQEKKPFTQDPMSEFASSGSYYFANGSLMFRAFREMIAQDMTVNGEFYVSMAYRPLLEAGEKVAIYEIQHFMQWGTPDDLVEYQQWSELFRRSVDAPARRAVAHHSGTLLVPMAGLGSRFTKEGYTVPKPLIEVDGYPMVVRAALDMPQADRTIFVTRADLPCNDLLADLIRKHVPGSCVTSLMNVTEGQAQTCLLGMNGCDLDAPITFAPCDSGVLFDQFRFAKLLSSADVIVWAFRGHAAAKRNPTSFSWIETTPEGKFINVSLKRPTRNVESDPIVIGAFTFKKAKDFVHAANILISRNERINNEFYTDAVVNIARENGLKVRIFEVDHYIGWGTPDEYKTFKYWQSCFHKWGSHPYRLDKDLRINPETVSILESEYAKIVPKRPPA